MFRNYHNIAYNLEVNSKIVRDRYSDRHMFVEEYSSDQIECDPEVFVQLMDEILIQMQITEMPSDFEDFCRDYRTVPLNKIPFVKAEAIYSLFHDIISERLHETKIPIENRR